MAEELMMSDLERMVYEWLTKRGILFEFQSQLLGGRLELGGAVADFILIEEGIILRIQGEYWHTGVEAEAQDKLQRLLLEELGYRVVDIQESDLIANIDLVMERAIQGMEMSPIDTHFWKPNIGMMAGFYPSSGQGSAGIPSSHTTPTVQTNEPSSVSLGAATLNGTLTYDGGIACDVRFRWGEAEETDSTLCWIFPFNTYELLPGVTPEVELTMVNPSSYEHVTDWQHSKVTNDAFTHGLTGLSDQWYNYVAECKNPTYQVSDGEVCFMGVA